MINDEIYSRLAVKFLILYATERRDSSVLPHALICGRSLAVSVLFVR